MKKLMLVLVALVVAPAMAAVQFTGSYDEVTQVVTIGYTTTDGDLPRGLALNLASDDGVTMESLVTESYGCFNVYLDYAFANSEGYAVGDGHPLADPLAAGVGTLPSTDISICMGYLDEDLEEPKGEAGPAECPSVIQLNVTGTGTIVVTADTLRGPNSGVVGSELDSNLLVEPLVIVIGGDPPVCMAVDNPDFTRWVAEGSPACWCYEFQCQGDADGLMQFSVLSVYTDDLAILLAAYGQMDLSGIEGGICADFDHLVQFSVLPVYTDDLAVFLVNYGQMGLASCSTGLPNSDFNFWETP